MIGLPSLRFVRASLKRKCCGGFVRLILLKVTEEECQIIIRQWE
jgi:hypothetical protein